MKVFNISSLAIIALLSMSAEGVYAINMRPNNINLVQSSSKNQASLRASAELFAELNQKIKAVQQAAAKGDNAGASLAADDMNAVVSKVESRWMGAIDRDEPEIVDEFLHAMQDSIREIHKTEGFMNVKVAKARDAGDDWLTKIVKGNAKMQSMIPPIPGPEDRVAVADS